MQLFSNRALGVYPDGLPIRSSSSVRLRKLRSMNSLRILILNEKTLKSDTRDTV